MCTFRAMNRVSLEPAHRIRNCVQTSISLLYFQHCQFYSELRYFRVPRLSRMDLSLTMVTFFLHYFEQIYIMIKYYNKCA